MEARVHRFHLFWTKAKGKQMKRKNYRILRSAPKPQMPVEALDLADDQWALELATQLLEHVNPDHIATVENLSIRRDCEDDIRMTISKLKRWRHYAWNRMRSEFLAPLKT